MRTLLHVAVCLSMPLSLAAQGCAEEPAADLVQEAPATESAQKPGTGSELHKAAVLNSALRQRIELYRRVLSEGPCADYFRDDPDTWTSETGEDCPPGAIACYQCKRAIVPKCSPGYQLQGTIGVGHSDITYYCRNQAGPQTDNPLCDDGFEIDLATVDKKGYGCKSSVVQRGACYFSHWRRTPLEISYSTEVSYYCFGWST